MATSMTWLLLVIVTAVVLVPRIGLLALWRRRAEAAARAAVEDALKHLLEREYRGQRASFTSLVGALRLPDATVMSLIGRMEAQGLVQTRGQNFQLTPEGQRVAMQVVRAHRLWERYLADEARLPLERLHDEAERQEHVLTPEEVDRLDASLGYPSHDPHGDPIPTRDGSLTPAKGVPATAWETDTPGRIVHLEDEPPLAYAQIVAAGLRVGQVVRVIEVSPQRVMLGDGENEYHLAPAVAANVFLTRAESLASAPDVIPLSDLQPGVSAEVVALDAACQGFSRRRLMDLGFTPGAGLAVTLRTFSGDPRAYRVRGTTIALRSSQAQQVLVRPRGEVGADAVRAEVAG